jgi:hypothetical protein
MTSSARRMPRLARAAAVALALAPVAISAQSLPERQERRPAPAAAAEPSPLPVRRAAAHPGYRYGLGLLLGASFEGSTAFKVRLEGTMALPPLSPQVGLELVLPVALSFWSQDKATLLYGYGVSHVRFELVPAARFLFPLSREISLYGDGGLGLAYFWTSLRNVPAGSSPPSEDSGAGGVFRVAAGACYALTDEFRLVFEPVGLNFYFGNGGTFVYSMLLGASYRF